MTSRMTSARVLLEDRAVGVLEQRAGRISFRYLDRTVDRPVLGLQYEYNPRIVEFDRVGGRRIHQEDFAQIFGLLPYEKERGRAENVGRVIRRECPHDLDEYVRRLTACIVMGNTDEHLKNWSLQYPGGRQRQLSPAYDLVSVMSYESFRRDTLTLPFGEQPDTRHITLDHFRTFAETIGTDPDGVVGTVRQTVSAMADSWAAVRKSCPVPRFVVDHIDERLRGLPLVKKV